MRRLVGADSLRSDNRYPLDQPHCGGSGPIGPRLMSRCLEPGSDSLCSLLDVRELI
jgi:hypothetical protein